VIFATKFLKSLYSFHALTYLIPELAWYNNDKNSDKDSNNNKACIIACVLLYLLMRFVYYKLLFLLIVVDPALAVFSPKLSKQATMHL